MKKNLFLLTFFILGLPLYSQPNLKWAFSISDSSALLLHEVIHDNSNNIYVLGGFYGDSIDIDPSNSKHIVTQTTAWGSMFLAKYSNAGNLLCGFSIDSCYATSMIINNGKIIAVIIEDKETIRLSIKTSVKTIIQHIAAIRNDA